jgi:hypothetical protein
MGAAARSQLVRSGRAPESSGDGRFAHNADAWRSPAVKKVGSRSISARATVSGSRGESRPTDRCFMVVAVAAVGALGRLPPAPPQAAAPVTREQKASDAQEELALFRCVRLVVGSPHEWTLPKPKAGGTAAHSGVQFTSTSQPRAEPAQFARLCDSLHATQHITRGPRLSRRATAIARGCGSCARGVLLRTGDGGLVTCTVVALSRVVGDLSPLAIFAGRVLDECNHPACHEPGGAHGFAGARHLDDLDDPATRRDFNAATSSCGDDLVGPRPVVCSNNDLDPIALHRASVPPRSGRPVFPRATPATPCDARGAVALRDR